jgi:hypothetical protein
LRSRIDLHADSKLSRSGNNRRRSRGRRRSRRRSRSRSRRRVEQKKECLAAIQ